MIKARDLRKIWKQAPQFLLGLLGQVCQRVHVGAVERSEGVEQLADDFEAIDRHGRAGKLALPGFSVGPCAAECRAWAKNLYRPSNGSVDSSPVSSADFSLASSARVLTFHE